jgi:hypothetical protein
MRIGWPSGLRDRRDGRRFAACAIEKATGLSTRACAAREHSSWAVMMASRASQDVLRLSPGVTGLRHSGDGSNIREVWQMRGACHRAERAMRHDRPLRG